jgi:hypothetical protein
MCRPLTWTCICRFFNFRDKMFSRNKLKLSKLRQNMNSTERSLKRIYAYMMMTDLETPVPIRRAARTASAVTDALESSCVASGLDYSALIAAAFKNPESRQYQKCLSRLTLEALPPMLNRNQPLSSLGIPLIHQN